MRRTYTRTRGSGKGTPILSLGDIHDCVETADDYQHGPTRSFAQVEIVDSVGGTEYGERCTEAPG
jgi:hypothetical protein